ncbi:MAG: cadmium-translocating P-type ATPase, partial [Parasporobacterium sp.]|nr:cadmium-translocating P-type ATPase [Parasporobacterium sp.]
MNRKQKKVFIRILITVVLMAGFHFLPLKGMVRFGAYLIPYLVIGYDILIKAFKGIKNRQVFDENFLMAVATVGAIALAVGTDGDYTEAIAVMLFYQTGELFQSYAVGKSRKNISELMDIRPDYANVEAEGKLVRTDPDEVEIGTVITVCPGEKIPIDGYLVEGSSTLNTSALTGESMPREVTVGDEAASGCINITGLIKIKTTREFGESTASKILDLVENASSRKSKSEEFISRFARIYTPAVCISALVLALLPPLVQFAVFHKLDFGTWIYRALTFLVISCPCALVISIPLSFFAGIGGAGREGILVKGSNFLETLSKVKTIVFDKTGTLTRGVFEVEAIHHSSMEDEKLLEYAALAESASNHPISKSILTAHGKDPDRSRVMDIKEISGMGITASVDGVEVAAGNEKLMDAVGVSCVRCHKAGTIIHMSVDGVYQGHIVINDVIKPEAKEAITKLRSAGIERTVMLTGDGEQAAAQVAADLGI